VKELLVKVGMVKGCMYIMFPVETTPLKQRAHYNPYLAIKTVQGSVSTWVPSINDVLAEDWEVVE
jgi:hypothetical protein